MNLPKLHRKLIIDHSEFHRYSRDLVDLTELRDKAIASGNLVESAQYDHMIDIALQSIIRISPIE